MADATTTRTAPAPHAASAANGASHAPQDKPLVYVNGHIVPKSQAAVSVFDHGLLYGDGVFEGIRFYNKKIFKARQHLDRLYHCAAQIRLNIHISKEQMLDIQRRCIEANELSNGYIRLLVTRGVGTLGLNPFTCPTPGIICIADQIRLFPEEMYRDGMKVVIAKRPKTPIACLDPRIKSLNYLNNILAKVEAIDAGLLECIMLTTDGYVSEGSGDNLFYIKDNILYTPPTDVGLLEGITRRFVINELAPSQNLKVVEKRFKADELLKADEVFLTGTAAEIIAVTQIDSTVISNGEGPLTAKLRAAFRRIVTSPDVPEN